jgi:hypothetical protein
VLLVCKVYSEIALSRKLFGIGHMYIYTFLLTMTDTMTSQNIEVSSWDILYIDHIKSVYIYVYSASMFGTHRIFWKTVSIYLTSLRAMPKHLRGFRTNDLLVVYTEVLRQL